MDSQLSHDAIRRRGMAHVHVGKAGALVGRDLSKRADCSSGSFYKSPTAGQSLNTTSDITISWDTSCLSVSSVDIYLYAPESASTRIYEWSSVDFAKGSLTTALQPKWWNNAETINLQLAIVEANTPAFLATLPAGPIFTAHAVAAPVEQKSGMAKGAMAAAAVVPIIVIGLLIAGAWLRISRQRGQAKRKEWSESVDRRMSTISTNWQSITPSGASAAIRNSMAVGNRNSSFSFGAIRPMSTVAEGGHPAANARSVYTGSVYDGSQPHMAQLRPGVRASAFEERRSRAISFADQVRPSEETRRSHALSRAYLNEVVPVPPLPVRSDSGDISPVQREGALSLSPNDIHARLSGIPIQVRPSMDEVLPALSMMRQGGDGSNANDTLLTPITTDLPAPPTPTHDATAGQLERSPIMGIMPMQTMPAAVMSPDELLRQYAEQRRTGSMTPASPVQGGMRVLYTPPPATPSMTPTPGSERASMLGHQFGAAQ